MGVIPSRLVQLSTYDHEDFAAPDRQRLTAAGIASQVKRRDVGAPAGLWVSEEDETVARKLLDQVPPLLAHHQGTRSTGASLECVRCGSSDVRGSAPWPLIVTAVGFAISVPVTAKQSVLWGLATFSIAAAIATLMWTRASRWHCLTCGEAFGRRGHDDLDSPHR